MKPINKSQLNSESTSPKEKEAELIESYSKLHGSLIELLKQKSKKRFTREASKRRLQAVQEKLQALPIVPRGPLIGITETPIKLKIEAKSVMPMGISF